VGLESLGKGEVIELETGNRGRGDLWSMDDETAVVQGTFLNVSRNFT